MNVSDLIFWGIFLGIGGTIIFRRLKYRSWTGAFLSATIQRTVGEVALSKVSMVTRKLRVDILEGSPSEEAAVGLTITATAVLGASMMPFKMTRQQALELSALLRDAANEPFPNNRIDRPREP